MKKKSERTLENSLKMLPGQSLIKVSQTSWIAGGWNRVNSPDSTAACYYRKERGERDQKIMGGIPVEFFSHELMDVSTESDDDIFSFINEWGMPYMRGVEKSVTDSVLRRCPREVAAAYREINPYKHIEVIPASYPRTVIDNLQLAVAGMFRIIKTGVYVPVIDPETLELDNDTFFNDYLVSEYATGMRRCTVDFSDIEPSHTEFRFLENETGLTSAICNQILDFIDDPAIPWICAAKGCKRIFKRQRHFHGGRENINSASDSVYCSDRCREKDKQRKLREREKAAAQKAAAKTGDNQ